MKNLILVFSALIFTTIASFAQEEAPHVGIGRSLVGGGLSASISNDQIDRGDSLTDQGYQQNAFSISPTYGKFFNDHWLAGASLDVGFANSSQYDTQVGFSQKSSIRSSIIGLTFFLRRYVFITERFGAFSQPGLSYYYQSRTNEWTFRNDNAVNEQINSMEENSHGVSIGSKFGLYYFVTPHFSIETNLLTVDIAYNRRNQKRIDPNNNLSEDSKISGTSLNMDFANRLSLIFNYYF